MYNVQMVADSFFLGVLQVIHTLSYMCKWWLMVLFSKLSIFLFWVKMCRKVFGARSMPEDSHNYFCSFDAYFNGLV